MSIWIELNEADHLRRRVPCRIFNSNGTAPDTGAQGDAVIMAVNSLTTISLSSALTAVHAAQGMYMEQLTQSNCSVLGTHMLYHIAGDFPQHIATIQVVNSNPFSTQSNLLVNSIAANSYSGVTIQGLSNYANISNVTLHAGTHSNVTIQGVTRLNSNVTLNANTHSGATIQGLSNYANISNVTLHAGTHSDVTIQGVSNTANFPSGSGATAGEVAREVWANSGRTLDGTSVATIFVHPRSVWSTLRSDFTTPGSFGEFVWSQVTGISTGTVFGITDTSNFPSGSGATAGEVARAVWANSGRTLEGTSIATIFTHPRSIWSTLRSDYTTPGSFGEYVYSQVTGTSSGTVQGVTRVNSGVTLNADTHSGATIKGIQNYANISNVTLHVGTHSSVTIQGLSNYANISNVTLHAGTHSGATVQGVQNYANISNVTLHAGTHSNVTIQGVTRVNSGVTLNANTHSGATIAGIVDGGIIASTLASGAITSAKFASGAIDAVALATDAGQEIADRLIARNIEGGSDAGRTVKQVFATVRNKKAVEGSTLTVYEADDTTSSWTAVVTTGTDPISGIDPVT